MTAEIVALQANPDAAQPDTLSSGTNLLLPPVRTTDRFAHFPEEVYDLSAESHLSRFLKVLLGDAGAGQARKRMLIARMQQTLQGTHFYDLDRFYGGLFGVRRSQSELLALDPYSQTATAETWTQQHAKDASYRSRVGQFARAITYGATPTGMELVAEALLAVDCDVYESYIQADSSYRTVGEVETGYATVGDMEGVSIGTLEGAALGRMAGDNRREFVVRPKRRITQGEAYDLGRVLSRVKPADARFTIDTTGVDSFEELVIQGALADSNYWEIIPRVQASPMVASPYQVNAINLVEQPRPPFSGYQGEAWSYVGDIIGVSAFVGIASNIMPTQRVTLPDGSFIDYEAHAALLPKRHILAGRAASDGVMASHPFWSQSAANVPDLAPIYTDRVPLDALSTLLDNSPQIDALPQSPAERFWVTPERPKDDATAEVFEVRLAVSRRINYFAFEAAHYPHDIEIQTYDDDAGEWGTVARQVLTNSIPQYLPLHRPVTGHPQHSQSGHWQPFGVKIEPVTTRRVRFVLTRNGGAAPLVNASTEIAYSLALRGVDIGYRVHSLDDVPADKRDGSAIGTTTDPVGSTIEFSLRQQTAEDMVAGRATVWKCEPQPVNYAVVNLYLDVRDSTQVTPDITLLEDDFNRPDGSAQILNRSDGGHWVNPDGGYVIQNGEAFRTTAGISILGNNWLAADWGYDGEVTINVDLRQPNPYQFQGIFFGMQSLTGGNGYQVNISQMENWLALSREGANNAQVWGGSFVGPSWEDGGAAQHKMVIKFNPSTRRIQISFGGVPFIDWTDPLGTSNPIGSVLGLLGDSRASQTFDNVRVTRPGAVQKSNDSQMIERFFLDPTHSGAHLTIYWTNQVGEPSEDWYEQATWVPIPRDYTLQKGYVHIPPTMARHFKFEFTSLNAEPFESFLPIVRTVRLFPSSLIRSIAQGTATAAEDLPPGLQATMDIASTDVRYADTLDALTAEANVSQGYQATEALYAVNPVESQEMRARSWVYGFQPWHQGDPAPRFLQTGVHQYATVQMKHTTKVGFFVGLYDIKAFRLNNGADDDTQVYTEHFHDFRQIVPGFTWTFNPNAMTTELSGTATATSQVYSSRHNVKALQFATQQSEPEQLIPDDDFRDPAKGAYDWLSPDDWHRVGDAVLVYSPADHSVITVRYAQPLEQPLTPPSRGVMQTIVQPVFSYRNAPIIPPSQSGGQFGGIESPPVGIASAGRGYAAVRLTLMTSLDSPLLLQVVNNADDTVVTSTKITGLAGETIERVLAYDLTGLAAVKVRLVQEGVSDDQWKIDTLSFFDEGIVWEFSNNGGGTWVQAIGVRNNANAILTFPEAGNQLVWRVRGLRPHLVVSSLKMRPQYVGVQNARYLGTERGPNVSVFDADLPVQLDPEFTDWTKPIPRGWYAAYKRFPTLPVEGAPNVTEFARFYGRPIGDTTVTTDAVTAKKITARSGTERMDFFQPLAESATRTGVFKRTVPDTVPTPTDLPVWLQPAPDPARLVNRPVHPV